MSSVLEHIHGAVSRAKDNAHDLAHVTKTFANEKKLNIPYVDVEIQFIGASGLPKMDIVGSSDPYFVAKLDDKISFVSTVKADTLAPVWNEIWRVKNVPSDANLRVSVLDKDNGAPHDDYIGKFQTTVYAGAKEVEIEGPIMRRNRGSFWLKVDSKPAADADGAPYTFDGPIRYSRHFSPTVGRLTNLSDERLYSTWKMYVRGIPAIFGDRVQHWNREYKAAQAIFQGPTSIAVRAGIQAGHRMLYARSSTNGFGVITRPEDVSHILHGGARRAGVETQFSHRVKPAVYTYILSAEDDSFRFSETGAAFFVDFASKHALHANCAQAVRYSGEFHPRPAGGWAAFSDATPDEEVKWELVIDNNSGTYAPDPTLLPEVKRLLEFNFPGFGIFALAHEDPALKESREACRKYALENRGVKQEELQPHAAEGEETLLHHALLHGSAPTPSEGEVAPEEANS